MSLQPALSLLDASHTGEPDCPSMTHVMGAPVNARAHRVLLLVCGIWLLNAFDLVLTVTAYKQGFLQEGNPLARYMLQLGTPSVVLFKIGLVLIGSYPLLRFRHARITEIGTIVILMAYALLAVHWSECYEMYTLVAGDDVYMAEMNSRVAG